MYCWVAGSPQGASQHHFQACLWGIEKRYRWYWCYESLGLMPSDHLGGIQSKRCGWNLAVFRLLPNKTLGFEGVYYHGDKNRNERVTVRVCANMSGTEKLQLLVIGKSKEAAMLLRHQNPSKSKRSEQERLDRVCPLHHMAEAAWSSLPEIENKVAMIVDNCPTQN